MFFFLSFFEALLLPPAGMNSAAKSLLFILVFLFSLIFLLILLFHQRLFTAPLLLLIARAQQNRFSFSPPLRDSGFDLRRIFYLRCVRLHFLSPDRFCLVQKSSSPTQRGGSLPRLDRVFASQHSPRQIRFHKVWRGFF